MMSSKLILVLQGVGTGWRVGEHGLFGAHESEDIRTIFFSKFDFLSFFSKFIYIFDCSQFFSFGCLAVQCLTWLVHENGVFKIKK